MDKQLLHDKLVVAFMNYQHRLDVPFPLPTETPAIIELKFRADPIFNNKVLSMVVGVMHIIDETLEGGD